MHVCNTSTQNVKAEVQGHHELEACLKETRGQTQAAALMSHVLVAPTGSSIHSPGKQNRKALACAALVLELLGGRRISRFLKVIVSSTAF